jgi:hypothetical protein
MEFMIELSKSAGAFGINDSRTDGRQAGRRGNVVGCSSGAGLWRHALDAGMRLRGATDASVEKAFNGSAILRTHVLQPTWHFRLRPTSAGCWP